MMNGITEIASSISAELKRRLPKQRKREKLALLVSTMLDVRSANLMDLAAGLPLEADRTGPSGNAQRYMRYQWIVRLLGNALVVSDAVMEPFARDVLEQAAAGGEPLCLILDQVSDRHQMLMLALRWGDRALPLAWRVEQAPSGSRPRGRCLRRLPPGCPNWPGCGCWATGFTALPT